MTVIQSKLNNQYGLSAAEHESCFGTLILRMDYVMVRGLSFMDSKEIQLMQKLCWVNMLGSEFFFSGYHCVPFQFKRKQFPIRLRFAMTVNKSQGQTIPNVGVYLPDPVFSHGQLYVAMSRATARKNIRILALPPNAIELEEEAKKREEKLEEKG